MRGLAILILASLLAACTGLPRPDPIVTGLVSDELAAMEPPCLELPFRTDAFYIGADNLDLRAYRRGDGTELWDPEGVEMAEALREVGLLGAPMQSESNNHWVHRRYPFTALGKQHFRSTQDRSGYRYERLPPAFCYAHNELAQVIRVLPVQRKECGQRRIISILYFHTGFPDWIDNPRIARAFPNRLGLSDDYVPRFDGFFVQRRKGRGWQRGFLQCGKVYVI